MMTNSEMIEKLETDGLSSVSDMDFITNALEENDKLKAEIEQFSNELISVLIENELLKKKNELTNYYFEQYAAAIDEIEQLKAELEQSVKLPCNVGDILYSLFLENIKELTVIQINIGMNKNQNSLVIITKNERGVNEILELIDFGKTVFLTREEAEQHLKGKVEE